MKVNLQICLLRFQINEEMLWAILTFHKTGSHIVHEMHHITDRLLHNSFSICHITSTINFNQSC